MPLSDIALCSVALTRIGAATITSFSDGTAESDVAGALYAPVRDALLSAYPWSFALGQISLSQLSTPPLADYSSAYGLPGDFLRAISAGTGKTGRGLTYRIARGALHANSESVILTYVFRPDESEFPPYFEQALMMRLAAEFTIPVTEDSARATALYSLADKEFARAKSIDAQQDTPGRLTRFPLVDVRN